MLNAEAQRVIYNDINPFVSSLLHKIATEDIGKTIKYIERTIKKYSLSKANKEAYVALRTDYNSKEPSQRNPLDLYLLICFGFEHQIRFNSSHEFNNPCGNSGFNQEMCEKLIAFNMRAKQLGIEFNSQSYEGYENDITPRDFVYCDPPYLISCGAYNDGKRGFNGWNEEQEQQLLRFLERMNDRGIRFMLSNMVDRNGIENHPLNEWIERNHFRVIENANVTKRNRQNRKEIIIINY